MRTFFIMFVQPAGLPDQEWLALGAGHPVGIAVAVIGDAVFRGGGSTNNGTTGTTDCRTDQSTADISSGRGADRGTGRGTQTTADKGTVT